MHTKLLLGLSSALVALTMAFAPISASAQDPAPKVPPKAPKVNPRPHCLPHVVTTRNCRVRHIWVCRYRVLANCRRIPLGCRPTRQRCGVPPIHPPVKQVPVPVPAPK